MSSTASAFRRRHELRILIYNPSDYGDDVEFGGVFWHFAPQGVGTCHCSEHNQPGAVDNLGVHDLWAWDKDDKGNLLFGQPRKKLDGADALTIAEYMVSPACRGPKGFIILEGTPEEQDAQKREARQKWEDYYVMEVEQTILNWEIICANFKGQNPSGRTPLPPKWAIDAYTWRRKHRAQVGTLDRLPFGCDACGMDFHTRQELDAHVIEEHPARAATAKTPIHIEQRDKDAGDVLHFGERPAPGAGIRDRIGQVAQDLLTRAAQAGVALTVADRKGVMAGDRDVMQDILDRARLAEGPQAPPEAVVGPDKEPEPELTAEQKAEREKEATDPEVSGVADVSSRPIKDDELPPTKESLRKRR